jgi:hypothetical protein
MLPEMFLNEISLTTAPDIATGHAWASQLVLTMRAATSAGVQRALHVPVDFYSTSLVQDYTWRQWQYDTRVLQDLRHYLLSLATKVPYLQGSSFEQNSSKDIDCFCSGLPALGLRAAYVADGLALSVQSGPLWDSNALSCQIDELVEDAIDSRTETIRHASTTKHVQTHADWILTRNSMSVSNGSELGRQVGNFFPALAFCADVEKQLETLPHGALASTVRGLFRLNEYCVTWQSGPFNSKSIAATVSPESPSTMNKYSGERTFLCPDGQQRSFSWHLKAGHWRIYFDHSIGPGKMYIGYVGAHLRTAKHG